MKMHRVGVATLVPQAAGRRGERGSGRGVGSWSWRPSGLGPRVGPLRVGGAGKIMNGRPEPPSAPALQAGLGIQQLKGGRRSAEGRGSGGVAPGKGMSQGEGVERCGTC